MPYSDITFGNIRKKEEEEKKWKSVETPSGFASVPVKEPALKPAKSYSDITFGNLTQGVQTQDQQRQQISINRDNQPKSFSEVFGFGGADEIKRIAGLPEAAPGHITVETATGYASYPTIETQVDRTIRDLDKDILDAERRLGERLEESKVGISFSMQYGWLGTLLPKSKTEEAREEVENLKTARRLHQEFLRELQEGKTLEQIKEEAKPKSFEEKTEIFGQSALLGPITAVPTLGIAAYEGLKGKNFWDLADDYGKGVLDSFREPEKRLPIVGSALSFAETSETIAAAKKKERGEELTSKEESLIKKAQAEQLPINRSWAYQAGRVVGEMPTYIGEFWLGKTFIADPVAKGLFGKMGMGKLVEVPEWIQKGWGIAPKSVPINGLIAKGIGIGIHAGTHSIAKLPENVAEAAIPYQEQLQNPLFPELYEELGEFEFEKEMARAFGSEGVEIMSEYTGYLFEGPTNFLGKAILAKYLAKLRLPLTSKTFNRIARQVKWNGIIGEVFEEELAELLQAPIEGRKYNHILTPQGMERLLTETVGIASFGGIGRIPPMALDISVNTIRKYRQNQVNKLLDQKPNKGVPITEDDLSDSEKFMLAQFEGFDDLSTNTIGQLKGKTEVSRQFIEDLNKREELKKAERDIVNNVLKEYEGQEKIPAQEFSEKVRGQLLPLKSSDPTGGIAGQYMNISLQEEERGEIEGYEEIIYESPISTSAGDVHFSSGEFPRYFAHVRTEDLPIYRKPKVGNVRRIIEIQSDLFQKGMEREAVQFKTGTKVIYKGKIHTVRAAPFEGKVYLSEIKKAIPVEDVESISQYQKQIKPYKNIWHERIIREEIKRAAKKGKDALRFPTGETAMKIERLGEGTTFTALIDGTEVELTMENFDKYAKPGQSIWYEEMGEEYYIIQSEGRGLGNGKFKAIAKNQIVILDDIEHAVYFGDYKSLEEMGYDPDKVMRENLKRSEEFDISGEIDTSNPIYKFYENTIYKYLKKTRPDLERITDDQGVEWFETKITELDKKTPVYAFMEEIDDRIFFDIKGAEEFDASEMVPDIMPENVDNFSEKALLIILQTNLRRRGVDVDKEGAAIEDLASKAMMAGEQGTIAEKTESIYTILREGIADILRRRKAEPTTERFITEKDARKILDTFFDPQTVRFMTQERITTDKGRSAWGKYCDAMITVVERAGMVRERAVYHEAFHAYLNMFHTKQEVADILNEFRSWAGTKRGKEITEKYTDKTLTEESSPKQTEEVLSDFFAAYQLGEVSVSTRIRMFFERMINRISGWIGKEYKVAKAFDDMINNKRAIVKIDGKNRVIEKYMEEGEGELEQESKNFIKKWTSFENILDRTGERISTYQKLKDELTPDIFEELSKYKPDKPIKLYRFQERGRDIEPLSSWAKDKTWVYDMKDVKKNGEVLERIFDPNEILVDIERIPSKEPLTDIGEVIVKSKDFKVQQEEEISELTPEEEAEARKEFEEEFESVREEGEKKLFDDIKELGGLKTDPTLKEEMSDLPIDIMRKNGMMPDEMVEYLNQIGYRFESTSDLIDSIKEIRSMPTRFKQAETSTQRSIRIASTMIRKIPETSSEKKKLRELEKKGRRLIRQARVGGKEPPKTTIRRTTGMAREERMITKRESVLNRELLRNLERGGREGRINTKKEIKEAQTALINMLEKADLPAKDFKKFSRTIKNIDSSEKLLKELPELRNRIVEAEEKNLKAGIREKIEKEIKGIKDLKKGPLGEAKFDYESNKFLQDIKDKNRLTQKDAMAELENMPEEGLTEDQRIKARFLSYKANGADSSLTLTEQVLADLQRVKELGKQTKDIEGLVKKINRQEKIDDFSKAVDKYSKKRKGIKNFINRLKSGYMRGFGILRSSINAIAGKEMSDLYNPEVLENRKGTAIYYTGEKIKNEFAKIIGETKNIRIMRRVFDMSQKEYNLTDKEGIEKELSKWEIIDIYNSLKNDLKKEQYYNTYGEEPINVILSNLTNEDIAIADLLMDEVQEYREVLNERHIEITGRDLGTVENYWPGTTERKQDIFDDIRRQSDIPSALKKRVQMPTLVPVPKNAWMKALKHISEAEHTRHLSRRYEELRRLITDRGISNKIESIYGEKALRHIENRIESIALNQQTEKIDAISSIWDRALNNWVSAKIVSPTVFVRQWASIFNYLEQVPGKEFANYMREAVQNPKKTFDFMWNNVPFVRARFNMGYSEALTDILEGAKKLSALKSEYTKGLSTLVRSGDIGPIIFGGYAVIQYEMKKHGDMQKAIDVLEGSTLEHQQSPLESSRSGLQTSKNPIAKTVFRFKNTLNQYLRKEVDAIISYAHGDISGSDLAKATALYGVIAPTLYVTLGWATVSFWKEVTGAIIGTGGGEDDDESMAAQIMRQIVLQPFQTIPVIDGLSEYAYRRIAGQRTFGVVNLPLLDDIEMAAYKLGKKEITLYDFLIAMSAAQEPVTAIPTEVLRRYLIEYPTEKEERKDEIEPAEFEEELELDLDIELEDLELDLEI